MEGEGEPGEEVRGTGHPEVGRARGRGFTWVPGAETALTDPEPHGWDVGNRAQGAQAQSPERRRGRVSRSIVWLLALSRVG